MYKYLLHMILQTFIDAIFIENLLRRNLPSEIDNNEYSQMKTYDTKQKYNFKNGI